MHVHQSEVCRRQTTVAAINSWLLQGSSKVLSVTMVPDEQLLLRLILLIRPATSSNLETEEHEQRTLTWPRNLRFDVMVITLVGKQKISSLTTTPRDCRQSSFLPSVKIFPAQSVTQNSFGPSSIFWCAESFAADAIDEQPKALMQPSQLWFLRTAAGQRILMLTLFRHIWVPAPLTAISLSAYTAKSTEACHSFLHD
ncbi:hypothetical protein BHM03_00036467, partial [Ensete ventricosum]